MSDKKKKLSFESDNLAVPEIHTGSVENDDLEEPQDDIVYDTLAIPEIKIHGKKSKQ